MRKFTLRHAIDCSTERFWQVFLDADFNTKMYLEGLKFPAYAIVSDTNTEGRIERTVRGIPPLEAPKAVRRLLGESFGYEEHGVFDPDEQRWRWHMVPNTLANKLISHGTVSVEPIDANRCRRIAVMECEAKIFGVGSVLESFTEKELRRGWDHSAVFMNRWLAADG